MAEFHIVLEHPQNEPRREHKKRPRLVTSCDNCRTKKLRCIKSERANAPCESCVHAKIPCEFRDREQYLAERNKMAKQPSGPKGRTTSPSFVHDVHSYFDPSSGYLDQPFVQTPTALPSVYPNDFTVASPGAVSARYAGLVSNNGCSNLTVMQEDLHPELFDPKCWQRPNPLFMISFINAFFHNGGDEFGFLCYEDTLRLFFQDDLSYLLATCIAAWAVRYNTIPEFSRFDGKLVSNKYVAHAKGLLSSTIHVPSLASLHSLVILAWLGSEDLGEFFTYAKLARDMLHELHAGGVLAIGNVDHVVLHRTWSSVDSLVATASEALRSSPPTTDSLWMDVLLDGKTQRVTH